MNFQPSSHQNKNHVLLHDKFYATRNFLLPYNLSTLIYDTKFLSLKHFHTIKIRPLLQSSTGGKRRYYK